MQIQERREANMVESIRISASEQSVRDKKPMSGVFGQVPGKWRVNQSMVEGWMEQVFGKNSETTNDLLPIVRREFVPHGNSYK